MSSVLTTLPDIAIGAIGAALIAAVVAFVSLVITKENKTSEFRQAWIEAVRSDVSRIIAYANSRAIHSQPDIMLKDNDANSIEITHGLHEASANLFLRLNPNEELTGELLQCLHDLDAIISSSREVDRTELGVKTTRVASVARTILKREWSRVKRGEPTFQIVKWASLTTFIVLPILLLLAN